jgi:hypothetical protein
VVSKVSGQDNFKGDPGRRDFSSVQAVSSKVGVRSGDKAAGNSARDKLVFSSVRNKAVSNVPAGRVVLRERVRNPNQLWAPMLRASR